MNLKGAEGRRGAEADPDGAGAVAQGADAGAGPMLGGETCCFRMVSGMKTAVSRRFGAGGAKVTMLQTVGGGELKASEVSCFGLVVH